ncbi:threonyl-carbamoyl synthesis 6 isoform X1 [Rhynchophorus ferrugineus]|uniref:threonyl-carbamoyl synthesis 6 isoform X1 n=1 Tax=Rhynchophorus ferrugineus TaxID=354439 RepID=UPI003FCDE111
MSGDKNLNIDLELPFGSKRIAEIVFDVLRVDEEPRRSGVCKKLTLEDTLIKVFYRNFSASLTRQLRTALNNFFEKVDLITETIEVIGLPKTESYSYY